MDTRQKYVRLKQRDVIIILSEVLKHSDFKEMNPVSAGFCHISENKVACFGESVSLQMKSDPEDSIIATNQIFGMEAVLALL